MSVLKENGRGAVVLPDNVLFEGAGAETRKRRLLPNVKMFSDTIKDATAQPVHAVCETRRPGRRQG
jgi:predicted O-methyltransferase YrrM